MLWTRYEVVWEWAWVVGEAVWVVWDYVSGDELCAVAAE